MKWLNWYSDGAHRQTDKKGRIVLTNRRESNETHHPENEMEHFNVVLVFAFFIQQKLVSFNEMVIKNSICLPLWPFSFYEKKITEPFFEKKNPLLMDIMEISLIFKKSTILFVQTCGWYILFPTSSVLWYPFTSNEPAGYADPIKTFNACDTEYFTPVFYGSHKNVTSWLTVEFNSNDNFDGDSETHLWNISIQI